MSRAPAQRGIIIAGCFLPPRAYCRCTCTVLWRTYIIEPMSVILIPCAVSLNASSCRRTWLHSGLSSTMRYASGSAASRYCNQRSGQNSMWKRPDMREGVCARTFTRFSEAGCVCANSKDLLDIIDLSSFPMRSNMLPEAVSNLPVNRSTGRTYAGAAPGL